MHQLPSNVSVCFNIQVDYYIQLTLAYLYTLIYTNAVTSPQMPQVEEPHPVTYLVSWSAPIGAAQSGSSIIYEFACQSLITEIDSPLSVTTEPGQITVTVGNLSYGVTYNCSIHAHLPQIISLYQLLSPSLPWTLVCNVNLYKDIIQLPVVHLKDMKPLYCQAGQSRFHGLHQLYPTKWNHYQLHLELYSYSCWSELCDNDLC